MKKYSTLYDRKHFISSNILSKPAEVFTKLTHLKRTGTLIFRIFTVLLLMYVLNPAKARAQNESISIWSATTTPGTISDPDRKSTELGVKFRAAVNGFVTGIRFYKGPNNSGTHVGTLWSRTGTVLARATFISETSTGWQQVLFSSPVAITAGTTYVASYHANVGRYSINENYFTTNIGVNPVLQALASGVDGGNGVYRYGANSIFPNSSTKSSNYWVDVVFTTSIAPDTTPPTVTASTPANGASSVSRLSSLTTTFSEAIDQGTLNNTTFELRNSSNTIVPGEVTYNSTTRVATLTPSTALSYSTVYTATLKGGTIDPRIKDAAGNAMAADYSWSFTTENPTPLVVTSTSPANLATGVLTNSIVRTFFNQPLDPITINANTVELRNSSGGLVQASIAYNSSTLSTTLTPSIPLEVSTAYTFTLKGGDTGIKGQAGNALPANIVTSFTTASQQTLVGPFSIWDPTTTPVPLPATDPETRAVELGVKFRASVDGLITGIRFYKSATNTGEHVATLWSRTGTNLARATFIGESASGWQEVQFSAPVAITAGTTYVASYHTNTGRYAISENFFTSNVTTPYLQALAQGVDGPNGIYRYSANSIFPNSPDKSSNYWVDVLFVDNNPPRVTATTPLAGATSVSTTSTITATFSEGIDPTTLNSSTFELRNAANTVIPGAITYNSATRTVILTPSAALANSTVYTATLRGGSVNPQIKDLAGNTLSTNYSWSFTTAAAITPKVTATSPQNGSTGILTTASLTATFDLEIDTATLTNTTFELRNASNAVIPATISYNTSTRTATLAPSAALAYSMQYTATLKGGATDPRIKDLAGNPLAADFIWSFTTVAPTPLTVTATTPQNASTGVLTTANITATFNNEIDGSTLTSSTFELRNASNTIIPGTLTYSSATGIATLTPSAPLANSTVYTATLKGGLSDPRIKDLAGTALAANFTWSFTTAPVIAPVIVANTPANGATGILTTANLTATFDLAIDPATLTNATFELKNASNAIIPATISYNPSTRTATLAPSATLANSMQYTATLKGGATDPRVKDLAGNPLAADFVWSFTTVATTPLMVTANTPQSGATNVPTTTDISATFNNEIDEATLTSSTFELRNASNTVIPGTLTYASGTGTATLTPATALASSTVYTATLKGGLSDPRIKDLAGNALAANFSWSFTTAALVAPVVIANTPENGTTGISRTTTVTAVFDLQIDPATITNNTFELRSSNNTLIPSIIDYNSISRTATLTPSEPLDYSTVYTATLKGGSINPRIEDINGHALAADYVWSFAVVDAPALVVIGNNPSNGATGVLTTASVNATFNHDINSATLTTSTFTLRNSSNTAIPGTITYDPETRTATFMPSTALANSSVYTATLKGGTTDPRIKAISGNAMATDYVWTFTTISGGPQTSRFSIWPATTIPGSLPANDTEPVELGVKFQASTDGFITGIRFYKNLNNTGTHIGNLWSRNGTNLARVTFSTETSSGWQEVLFNTPVAITKGTTYIASYFTPTGNYSFDGNYFATSGSGTDPVLALQDGSDGPNGVFSYSSASTFPSFTFNSTNYWVDIVFETILGPDVKSPTVTSTSPSNQATGISISSDVLATFSEAIDEGTVSNLSFKLNNTSGQTVSAVVSYSSTSRTATLSPSSPLEYSTDYVATLKGIRDQAGNMMADFAWTFKTSQAPPLPPAEGPGGPILVISSASNPFSRYSVEILRAEGLNEFKALDISAVTPLVLSEYDVVILGEQPLTLSQVTMLTDWVNGGGTFISFRPDVKLASLLGITRTTGTAANQYLLVNTAAGPGVGIVNETIQYHGTADLYTLSGATALATLYSTVNTATTNPAVTSRNVGVNGGQAVAFTYDLARSIVYTRQGNPAWEGQDRDGLAPVRSNDLYYGNASFDRKPDWIDFKKVAIPQADEQQRLLANIIIQGNLDRKPLPRFWYLPKGLKAAVVMTGDDHANAGTIARFNHYKSISTSNTADAVADWIAIRSTSYIYPYTPITNSQINAFQADGFEIALHLYTDCGPFTETSWLNFWNEQWNDISTTFPALNAAVSNRTHCLPWTDWTSQPKNEASKGVRVDANYYYWPGSWVQSRAGMFTGSGLPMRFADLNGNIIDCYQVTTQVTDESDISNYSVFISSLLDKAKGPEGFYGTFCANMHTDNGTSTGSEAIINSAVARGIPVISAKQLLTWLDGRNNSAFKTLTWNNNELNFDLIAADGSRNLKGMLPLRTLTKELSMILKGTASVPFTKETIKGIEYAFFDGKDGNYTAIYGTSAQPLANISAISEMNLLNSSQKTLNQDIKLSVYPNPFAKYATAEFSTPKNEEKVYLDVYNVNGVKIKNLYEGPTLANELNRFEINSLNLSPGVYFIHFITPQKTVTTKVITN